MAAPNTAHGTVVVEADRRRSAARREDHDLLLKVIRRVRRGPHLIPVHEHLQLLERAAPVEAGGVATVRAEELHRVRVARRETRNFLFEVVARALCSIAGARS